MNWLNTIIESVKIEDVKSIQTITLEPIGVIGLFKNKKIYVRSLLLFKDGRIDACSSDKTIRIYDPFNDYHCDQMIET